MVPVKSTVKISQTFMAFSEYMNFKEIISRDHDCMDFHEHCKKILELDPQSCDDDFISNQFMKVACMETCGRCEDKVRFNFKFLTVSLK